MERQNQYLDYLIDPSFQGLQTSKNTKQDAQNIFFQKYK